MCKSLFDTLNLSISHRRRWIVFVVDRLIMKPNWYFAILAWCLKRCSLTLSKALEYVSLVLFIYNLSSLECHNCFYIMALGYYYWVPKSYAREGWIANWRIFKLLRTWDGNLVCWERKNEFKHQENGLEEIKHFDL